MKWKNHNLSFCIKRVNNEKKKKNLFLLFVKQSLFGCEQYPGSSNPFWLFYMILFEHCDLCVFKKIEDLIGIVPKSGILKKIIYFEILLI